MINSPQTMRNIPRHIPANPHRIRLHKHRSSTTWQLSHLLGTRYLHSALVPIYRVYDLRFTVGSHRRAKPKAKPKPLEFLKCPLKRAACLRARPQLSDSMIIRVCTCSLGFPIRGIDWHRNRSPLSLSFSLLAIKHCDEYWLPLSVLFSVVAIMTI